MVGVIGSSLDIHIGSLIVKMFAALFDLVTVSSFERDID